MVTLTLGKKWQAQVEEIAGLKIEKAEIQEEHTALVKRFAVLESELAEYRSENAALQSSVENLKSSKAHLSKENSELRRELESMQSRTTECSESLSETQSSMYNLQKKLDESLHQQHLQSVLIEKLQEEINRTDQLKTDIEADKQQLMADFQVKQRQLELAEKAKAHSEKHVSILVKEKDRLIGKQEPKSKKNEPQVIMAGINAPSQSWAQVEVLRLKNTIKQLQEHSQAQQTEIDKVKKENWNLLNRLRNNSKRP